MDTRNIEELAKKLANAIPENLKTARDEAEETFRGVLKSGLQKMDLVTREEFDVQEAVLQRTREKLEALERRLDDLSKDAPGNSTPSQ